MPSMIGNELDGKDLPSKEEIAHYKYVKGLEDKIQQLEAQLAEKDEEGAGFGKFLFDTAQIDEDRLTLDLNGEGDRPYSFEQLYSIYKNSLLNEQK